MSKHIVSKTGGHQFDIGQEVIVVRDLGETLEVSNIEGTQVYAVLPEELTPLRNNKEMI